MTFWKWNRLSIQHMQQHTQNNSTTTSPIFCALLLLEYFRDLCCMASDWLWQVKSVKFHPNGLFQPSCRTMLVHTENGGSDVTQLEVLMPSARSPAWSCWCHNHAGERWFCGALVLIHCRCCFGCYPRAQFWHLCWQHCWLHCQTSVGTRWTCCPVLKLTWTVQRQIWVGLGSAGHAWLRQSTSRMICALIYQRTNIFHWLSLSDLCAGFRVPKFSLSAQSCFEPTTSVCQNNGAASLHGQWLSLVLQRKDDLFSVAHVLHMCCT